MNTPAEMLTLTITIHEGRDWSDLAPGTYKQELFCLEDCQRFYVGLRDRLGLGGSQFSAGRITDANGNFVANVSYNGRVWDKETWARGDAPLMELPSVHDLELIAQ